MAVQYSHVPSSLLAGAVAWATSYLWENYVGSKTLFQRIGAVFVPLGANSLLYIALLLLLKTPQAQEATSLLRARFTR